MTRVLQFTAPNPPADTLVRLMCMLLNNASGIARLTHEPGYNTRPFSPGDFRPMASDPNTRWIDYDATLPHLTDHGRTLMQSLIEGVSLNAEGNLVPAPSGKGMLQLAPMVFGTEIKLKLADVEDLAQTGYIDPPAQEPVADDEPPPFVDEPPLHVVLPEPEVSSVWIYVECTTQEFTSRWNAAHAGRDIDLRNRTMPCPPGPKYPRWALYRAAFDAQEAGAWKALHVTTVEPVWTNAQKSTARWYA